nr:hypothetical protein BaRGS_028207 [Batillaria attramentaria]
MEWTNKSAGYHRLTLTNCGYMEREIRVQDKEVFEVSEDHLNISDVEACAFQIHVAQEEFLSVVIETFRVEKVDINLDMDVQLTVDGGDSEEYWDHYDESAFAHAFVVSSVSSEMIFHVQYDSNVQTLYLRFRVIVSSASGMRFLEEVPLSSRSGYVTSFAFDGQTRYAHNTQAYATLQVFPGEVVMISFPHFDLEKDGGCRADRVSLYEEGYWLGSLGLWRMWSRCGQDDTPPQIYRGNITLEFVSDATETRSGFKMFYSFHPTSEIPQQLDTGLFNCSVPHYTSFRLHLDCNLETECTAGEDEGDCPYTSAACGPGFVDARNKCYRYVTIRKEITWYDAYEQCRSFEGYCLPVYLRCNGVDDCPGLEDEADCDSYTCPGFYRCRASSVCVHADHVCDGVFQCPQQDDELLCHLTCPQGCDCQGLAFDCNQTFSASSYPDLRYLDASTSGMTPDDLTANVYLVRLSLSACGLVTVPNTTFPNLRWLDLSANLLTSINLHTFVGLKNLHVLRLAANPLTSLTNSGAEGLHVNLHTLDLSLTDLDAYNGQVLAEFPHVTNLNMSHGALTTITVEGLKSTPGLEVLDVRQSPLKEFPHHLLRHLPSLRSVYASNFKLCCAATLPENFNLNNCHAPIDEIASCDDLLRSNAYRGFLWVMASMAIVGNAGSFAARVVQKEAVKTGFHVFVTNLSVADFLMGVYLTIIGIADQVYRGNYLWNDNLWKGSVACKMAGLLSLLSSEVSAFFICLITLDRFLVLRFPFSMFHFRKSSALVASAVAWAAGLVLAMIPLLPMTPEWEFYSQTGICIPLPVTRKAFEGQSYAFGLMVVFNFVLFILIVIGQVLIFSSIRNNTITTVSNRINQDATIARRLTTIVLSDFLCWFPIGLLGLLASTGTPIPSEVNVAMVIFVLPFNSALNPFLYTFNVIMEKRRKATEGRIMQQLSQQTIADTSTRAVARTESNMESSLPRNMQSQQSGSGTVNQTLQPEDVVPVLQPE